MGISRDDVIRLRFYSTVNEFIIFRVFPDHGIVPGRINQFNIAFLLEDGYQFVLAFRRNGQPGYNAEIFFQNPLGDADSYLRKMLALVRRTKRHPNEYIEEWSLENDLSAKTLRKGMIELEKHIVKTLATPIKERGSKHKYL